MFLPLPSPPLDHHHQILSRIISLNHPSSQSHDCRVVTMSGVEGYETEPYEFSASGLHDALQKLLDPLQLDRVRRRFDEPPPPPRDSADKTRFPSPQPGRPIRGPCEDRWRESRLSRAYERTTAENQFEEEMKEEAERLLDDIVKGDSIGDGTTKRSTVEG